MFLNILQNLQENTCAKVSFSEILAQVFQALRSRGPLNNWAVYQELWDEILEGKVNSEIWGQVIRVQMEK